MKWFQHETNMFQTDYGAYIRSKHGLDGYARWCILLELIASTINKDNRCACCRTLPIKEWCKYLEIRHEKLLGFLEDLKQIAGINYKVVEEKFNNSEKLINIFIPQLKDWCDNHIRNSTSKKPDLQVANKQELNPELNPELNIKSELNPKLKLEEEKRFRKPILEEVQNYIQENFLPVDANEFYNYYESNGWKVGRNPMKNWKAAISGIWTKNGRENQLASKVGRANARSQEAFKRFLQGKELDKQTKQIQSFVCQEPDEIIQDIS